MASWMYHKGIRQYDSIILIGESCYSIYLIMYACGIMGVIFSPGSPKIKLVDLRNRLKNLEPKAIIVCKEIEHTVKKCPLYEFKNIELKNYYINEKYNYYNYENPYEK